MNDFITVKDEEDKGSKLYKNTHVDQSFLKTHDYI